MKLTYTIIAVVFMAACSNNTATKENEEQTETTETTETPVEEPVVVEETKQSTADLLIGTWTFQDPKINAIQVITYNQDGSYSMKMGNLDITGTWELTGDVLITKSRPDAEGQKKTITKIDATSLTTFWEPVGGKGRELTYTRVPNK